MSFTVPATMPPAPHDIAAPAKIRSSTMQSYLLRDRFTFATSRRALLQLWPIDTVTSAAFVVVAITRVRLLPTSNGTIRITLAGTLVELRITLVSAGTTTTLACPSGSVIGTLTGCTPGALDTCVIELRRTTAAGTLAGLWLDDENLKASELP
jgi:hypothetical protein